MSKEKRSEMIHDALLFLDDGMIEDVEKLRGFVDKEEREQSLCEKTSVRFDEVVLKKKSDRHKSWKKWTALAASICVLVAGSWIYEVYIQPANNTPKIPEVSQENITEDKVDEIIMDDQGDVQKDDNMSDEISRPESVNEESLKDDLKDAVSTESLRKGVTIPKMKVSLKSADDVAADMLGFFILNGRSYIQYELHQDYAEKDLNFVGDYAGHITGMIDEWTEADGYVEGAGTYTGKVYEVKGVNPEFMLCMVWENGWVETFINHNDITLCKGADLVDERLDLRGNYNEIALETRTNDSFAFKTLELTEEEMRVFESFLDAFAEAGYVYVKGKTENPFGSVNDTSDMMDFYFIKENGVRLRFRTLGDGYVSFPWIDACVKIDQNIYDNVVDILQRQKR